MLATLWRKTRTPTRSPQRRLLSACAAEIESLESRLCLGAVDPPPSSSGPDDFTAPLEVGQLESSVSGTTADASADPWAEGPSGTSAATTTTGGNHTQAASSQWTVFTPASGDGSSGSLGDLLNSPLDTAIDDGETIDTGAQRRRITALRVA